MVSGGIGTMSSMSQGIMLRDVRKVYREIFSTSVRYGTVETTYISKRTAIVRVLFLVEERTLKRTWG
jgi:hypothetical protein